MTITEITQQEFDKDTRHWSISPSTEGFVYKINEEPIAQILIDESYKPAVIWKGSTDNISLFVASQVIPFFQWYVKKLKERDIYLQQFSAKCVAAPDYGTFTWGADFTNWPPNEKLDVADLIPKILMPTHYISTNFHVNKIERSERSAFEFEIKAKYESPLEISVTLDGESVFVASSNPLPVNPHLRDMMAASITGVEPTTLDFFRLVKSLSNRLSEYHTKSLEEAVKL